MQSPSSLKRILLKLSGETLLGDQKFGIDPQACVQVSNYLQKIHQMGIQLGIVIGGGNIYRNVDMKLIDMPRTPADQMGMLSTLLNGIALQQALLAKGVNTRLMTALDCPSVAERYNWAKALSYLDDGIVVIFVGGTGSPYFTTDTAAALRASEIHADMLLKATKVDGIYDKDPLKNPDAVKYSTITYGQVLAEGLKVMDPTAVTLCQSNDIPIYVFNMKRLLEDDLKSVIFDFSQGSLVRNN